MGLASSATRIGLGAVITGHGLQKLAGKFGGPGLDAAAAGFEGMGMKPGKPYATAAAVTETVGGGLLAAGMFTPLGAAMITGAMTVAIGKVHGKNGLWVTKGGMEYNLLIIGTAFALTEHGASFPAIDGIITKKRKGFLWAVIELIAGVAGDLAVMKLSEKTAPPTPPEVVDAAVADHLSAPTAPADATAETPAAD
jgi:putative oxidoreductase